MNGAPLLAAEGLVRDLGEEVKTRVLHGLDLRVRSGEFVALTGPSGSGKSTLLYLLGVLDRPTEGRVAIDGADVGALDDNARARLRNERIGFVFQFHFLLPEFNVLENVMLPMMRSGRRTAENCERMARETLGLLGLGDLMRRMPHQLSGGQQQRVSIARAVAHGPSILLADEPTGNLDTGNSEVVIEIFERLVAERGITIVMVTHEPRYAARAHRELQLEDGRIVADVEHRAAAARIEEPA